MEPTKELRQAVEKYREGKSEAFTQLYEESCKYIYTCIYKVMGGNDNAQDAVCDIMQDTYVEISRSMTQLDHEDSFLSWAGTIATRKCYAWLKKNRKYVLLDEEDHTLENLADDDNIIPEEIIQDREKQRLVREIIDTQLSEMQRLCIVAYYYNEQKQSEIAKELGLPENTVKTYLSRAKAKIRDGVLVTEKKQGIRLHAVAPLLAVMFKEDVSACEIPEEASRKMAAAISRLAGKKGVAGKLASVSVKAKIMAGTVAVAALCAVGGAVYMAAWPEEAVSQNVQAGSIENTEAENTEATQPEEEVGIENSDANNSVVDMQEEPVYLEQGNLFLLENVGYNPESSVDMNALEHDDNIYTLVKSVNIYDVDTTRVGYTKENFQIYVIVSNEQWSYCDFGENTDCYLVKTDELMNAISDEDKQMVASATSTPAPTPTKVPETPKVETPVNETPEVEIPIVESTPTVSEPVVDIPVVATPIEEQPVVVESDKYTPEEVIAIYRSVMESNGITWDPSIKEFASWGSGYFYLNKGWIEENAYSSVEAHQFARGTGTPWTLYYLEVTGSDENCVYITKWHSTN